MRPFMWAMPLVAALPFYPSALRAEPLSLTLERVRSMALKRSASVVEAALEQERVQADSAQLRRGPILTPTVELEAGPCFNGGVSPCAGATLTFPLPLRGEAAGLETLASVQVRAAADRSSAAGWQALNAASRAYVRALAAAEEARLVADSAVLCARVRDAAARRAQLGEAARLDLRLTTVRLDQREQEAAAAAAALAASVAELRRLLLIDGIVTLAESLDNATQRALVLARSPVRPASHPAMRVAQATVEIEAATLTVARRRTSPRLAVYAGYRREELHQVNFGITIPMGWFSAVPSGEVARAQSRSRIAEAGRELTALTLRISLAAARDTLRHAENGLGAATAFARSAGFVVTDVKRGYDLGHFDLFRVLQAEQVSLEAARAVVAARGRLALAALRVAAGGAP